MSRENVRRKHLRAIANAIFLISFPFGLLYFALPLLGKEMGAMAIAGLYSVFFLMTVLLRPLIGWVLERYGRRPFLLGGLAAYLIANLTFLLANSLGFLYLGCAAGSMTMPATPRPFTSMPL